MSKLMKFAPVVAAVVALTGCATSQLVNGDVATSSVRVTQESAANKENVLNANQRRVAAQDVQRPFLAGKSQPLSREATMPDRLRRSVPVTALFSGGSVPLETALQQLSKAAGVTLTATPDALLPAAQFGARGTPATANSPIQAPTRVVVQANNTPLWTVLDDIAAQAGASWRPNATGAEFYRLETRVYELNSINQVSGTSSSLGRQGGANAQFESQSKSGFEVKDRNVLAGIKSAVEAMLTNGGKLVLSPETQTLVVTDTVESLQRVDSFVKAQNKALGRRVRMVVEAIEVVAKDGNDLGLDWTGVYESANRALKVASPTSLVSSYAGSVGVTRSAGNYEGSSLVINALNEVGRVVNRRVFPVMATSGTPVTQALRSTFNYVDQVQATAISSSVINTTAQAPTVSQKDETVGTLMTVVPDAKADGTIFVSLSFDVTAADPLRPFTVGSGASAVTVQQKTINGNGILQQVPLRSGKTEVIGGMEVSTSQSTKRRLGDGVPMIFGGSDSLSSNKSVLLILVTAVTEEGI